LFALSRIANNFGDHLEAGYFQSTHGFLVRAAVRRLLQELCPDALALVDAFNISDRRLGSALGRWDGRVYEALAAMAQAGPLNRTDVTVAYQGSGDFRGLKGLIEDGWQRVGRDRLSAKL
jgi:acyl-CoA oxidase